MPSPDAAHTPYLDRLRKNSKQHKNALNFLLKRFEATGLSYIEPIFNLHNALAAVAESTHLGIAICEVNWWCLWQPDTPITSHCPHGSGGPTNNYGNGWFTECYHYNTYDVSEHGVDLTDETIDPQTFVINCNRLISNYLTDTYPTLDIFSPCMHPSLMFFVPNEW